MRKRIKATFLLVLAASLCLSCDKGGGEEGGPKPTANIDTLKTYYVKDVSYSENVPEGINLETEVHIVDNATGKSLLCAGVDNGLQYVQTPNIAYAGIDANFISAEQVTVPALSDFYVALIERDSIQCPGPAKWDSDKVIGKSRVFQLTLPVNEPIELTEEGNATITFSKREDTGTSFNVSELTKLSLENLKISNILSDEWSDPEVEMHFVNVLTNKDVACEVVEDYNYQEEGQDYSNPSLKPVLVNKVLPTDTVSLVRIVLIERDNDACPAPFTVGKDKVLGTSAILNHAQLFSGEKIIFPNNYATVTLNSGSSAPAFSISELTKLGLTHLNITTIDSDELSSPEIELHFVNPLTNQDVACEEVVDYNAEGVDYSKPDLKPMLVNNVSATDAVPLVQMVLIERDDGGCPAPFTVGKDKVLGRSAYLKGTDILLGQPISFLNNFAAVTLTYAP